VLIDGIQIIEESMGHNFHSINIKELQRLDKEDEFIKVQNVI
jgi:hypothetical protein